MKQIDFDTVHRLASVGSLVEPLRRAFVSQAVSPERAHYDLGALDRPRTLLLMPAWQPGGDIGVNGRALTLIRTAAVSALAADLLAPATPQVLLMVGTGAQLHAQHERSRR